MPETVLENVFAEFEAEAVRTFRPPGVADAERRMRWRRRRRRGTLAAVLALLLGGPASGYAVAGRNGDRATPTPTVSPARDEAPVDRTVTLPGVAGQLTELRFADARHGWALFDTCDSANPASAGCRRTLARTVDGGATWRQVPLPEAPRGSVHLQPADARRLLISAGDRFLVTTDGGATFTSHPADSHPGIAGLTTRSASGFTVECPAGAAPADDPSLDCARMRLVRVGGRVPRQPPLTLDTRSGIQIVEGGDGRLWMAVSEKGWTTVAVTADGAATWRKLPPVFAGERLLVSPDGADVWLLRLGPEKLVWQLVGSRWEERPSLPRGTREMAAAGGGMFAVITNAGDGSWWVDGRHVQLPGLRGALSRTRDGIGLAEVEVLADGTVVFRKGATWIVGVGPGTDRAWTRFS